MSKQIVNRTGQKFGKLTVMKFYELKDKKTYWLCKCDCGNEKVLSSSAILGNKTHSCGCLGKEVRKNNFDKYCKGKRKLQLTGQKFGRLTVKQELDVLDDTGNVSWLCECECGTELILKGKDIKFGSVKSCGCLAREVATISGAKRRKLNEYEIVDDYVKVYSNKDKSNYMLCDIDDWNKLCDRTWMITKQGYWTDGNGKFIHRIVMNCPQGMVVDHIMHKKYDNRKSQLRICYPHENSKNLPIRKANLSGYSGVSFAKKYGKWHSYIKVDYKRINIGYYDTPEQAAIAYNEAAIKYHGEFARLNEVQNVN